MGFGNRFGYLEFGVGEVAVSIDIVVFGRLLPRLEVARSNRGPVIDGEASFSAMYILFGEVNLNGLANPGTVDQTIEGLASNISAGFLLI